MNPSIFFSSIKKAVLLVLICSPAYAQMLPVPRDHYANDQLYQLKQMNDRMYYDSQRAESAYQMDSLDRMLDAQTRQMEREIEILDRQLELLYR